MNARDSQITHPKLHTAKSGRPWWQWLLFGILAIIVLVLLWYLQALRPTKTASAAIVVDDGDSTQQIADKLSEKKLIRSELAFGIYSRSKGYPAKFRAGRFVLNGKDGTPKIAEALTSNAAKSSQFTIKEGTTQKQIAAQLGKLGIVDEDQFADFKASDFPQYEFLKDLPKDAPLEGFLFPETYSAPPAGTSTKDVATIMLNQFEKELTPELQQEIKASGRSLYETVTIASILEREVKTAKDRRTVAGIVENRLKDNISLGLDTTLMYGLDKSESQLTKADLADDSPYNTRTQKGLPPTPISNPGLATIEATASPQASDYLFFLSAPNGTTYYATTNAEHEANKDKYLK